MRNLELVNLALAKRGAPYSTANRFGPITYDCSGLIHACLMLGGVDDSGAGGWTSRTYQDWIARNGAGASLAKARVEPGMIVTLGHTDGPHGHIGLTAGGGQVIETPSAQGHQVGVSAFDRNRWDFAGFIPGVTYSDAAPAPAPSRKPTDMELISSDGITWYHGGGGAPYQIVFDNDKHKDGGTAVWDLAATGTPHTAHYPKSALEARVNS